MADIARGRMVQDKDIVGGLRAVYFINYDESSSTGGLNVTFDTTNVDLITMLGSTVSLYKYDLRGDSSFVQSVTPSRANGTSFTDQTLNVNFKKLRIEDHADVYTLSTGRPIILVEDYEGNLQLAGLEYGMDMDPSSIETGAAMGDYVGYKLAFKGMEKKPANFVQEGAIWSAGNTGSLDAGNIFTGITINGVAGTAARS